MLILMRRPGESIHIGPNIVVTLVSLERNRARIGVDAPRDITVDREEVAEKKKNGIAPPARPGPDASPDGTGVPRKRY
jgi:carbon storage regulator